MKSKTSCFNKTIFKKNMVHFWPIWVIFLIYQLCVLPLGIYTSYLNTKVATGLTQNEMAVMKMNGLMTSIRIYINPGMIFMLSLFTVMAVFLYLYSPRSANMIHAMPVTRKELFITNYLSGITVLFIPQIISFVAAILVSAACGNTSLVFLLQGLCYALGLSFFFYSLCVFTAMFTGHILGLPFFAFVINFLFIGCKMIFSQLVGSISYGINGDYQMGKFDVLSPLYYLLSKVGIKYGDAYEMQASEGIRGGNVILGYCVVAVALLIIAYIIYQRKKMESAGSLISISFVRPIFRWGFGLCGASLFTATACAAFGYRFASREIFIAIIMVILFGIICFFAAQMLLEKRFMVFHKKRIGECAIFLILMIGLLTGIEADVFGLETKVPKEDDIGMAFVSMNYLVGGSEKEQIKDAIQIHKQVIDSKKEFELYAEENKEKKGDLAIKYILKNGTAMTRTYQIPTDETAIEDSGSIFNKIIDGMTSVEAYMSNYFSANYEDINMTGGSIELYGEEDQHSSRYFGAEEAEKLYQAVISDVEAGNMEQMIRNSITDNSKYEDETYYNTLYFDYYSKDGIRRAWDNFNSERMYNSGRYHTSSVVSKNAGAGLSFDSRCKNIIETLKDLGMISGTEELITIQEKTDFDEGLESTRKN